MTGREIRRGVRRALGLALHRPDKAANAADAEFESMIEEHVAHLVARGMDPASARAQALAALGPGRDHGLGGVRSSAEHRERTLRWRDTVADAIADARYGIRTLRRSPSFAIAAIATLALAIGANTAIFSAVNAVILRPLPFADPDRLVALWETNPDFKWTRAEAAPANMLDWRTRVPAFQDVGGYFSFSGTQTLTGQGEPRLLKTRAVTGNLFDVLGVRAAIGRTLDSTETWFEGTSRPVVLTHRTWRDVFGADSGIAGRSIQLNGRAITVAGVLPETFAIPGVDVDLFTSVEFAGTDVAQAFFRRAHFIRPVARLKPGMTLDQANVQFQSVVSRLQTQYPATNTHMGAGFEQLHDSLIGDTRRPLLVMLTAVGVLLLIACVNIANLLLVRAGTRQREAALRLALGAGRGRLARQALTESLVLAVSGGLAGITLGWWGTRALVALQPRGLLPVPDVPMNWPVLAYVSLVTVVSAAVFGVAPAMWATRRLPADVLKDDGRSVGDGVGARRWGDALLIGEVALALTLALGAGLLVRSYDHLTRVDPGFDPNGVITVSVNLPGTRYDSVRKVLSFFDELQRRVRVLPGVESAAVSSQIPLTTPPWSSQFAVEGRPPLASTDQVLHREISPEYQHVMRVPLKAGRLLSDADDGNAPNAVLVNEALVRAFFPSENPIGLRIAFDRIPTPTSTWRTIVGVVGDERTGALADDVQPEFIAPVPQEPRRGGMVLFARTSGDPALLAGPIRRVIAGMDPLLAIGTMRTMTEVREAALARDRFLMALMLAFALVGVALGVVGVYGVVAQLVRRRTRELGIRIALGAGAGQVQWLVVRHGLVVTLAGVALGVGAALTLTGALRSLLYQVAPTDPVTFGAVSLLLLLGALTASWIPARRASRSAPTEVLRAD